MIKYLSMEEKPECRPLWEEAFPEDSKSFDDYYFMEKMKENRVLVLEEDGEMAAMLHQNPYRLQVRGMVWQSDYLVGVATRTDKRKRGYMRQLLHHMMQEMWEEQMPFCFLMPADAAIYHPFGFTYIFDQPQWELLPELTLQVKLMPWKESVGASGYLAWMSGWMEQWLGKRYQVYAQRDEVYLGRLLKELASEEGTFEVLYDEDTMIGVRGIWGLKEREQRLLFCEPSYTRESQAAKPAIMARIICAEQFVKAIRLNRDVKQEELEILLKLHDPIVAQNDGSFCWHINHETSWLEMREENEGWEQGTVLELSIQELTGWLFGYELPVAASDYEHVVEVINGVFLDEIV